MLEKVVLEDKVCVIIPAYNVADTIGDVVKARLEDMANENSAMADMIRGM